MDGHLKYDIGTTITSKYSSSAQLRSGEIVKVRRNQPSLMCCGPRLKPPETSFGIQDSASFTIQSPPLTSTSDGRLTVLEIRFKYGSFDFDPWNRLGLRMLYTTQSLK